MNTSFQKLVKCLVQCHSTCSNVAYLFIGTEELEFVMISAVEAMNYYHGKWQMNFLQLSPLQYISEFQLKIRKCYIYLCANYHQEQDPYSIHVTKQISCTFCEIVGTKINVTLNYYSYHLYSQSCNKNNPPNIPIRDCPIKFMSQNKLVDNFAKQLAQIYLLSL